MSKVVIVPNKDGALVTPYAGNPKFGYLMLGQTKSSYQNGWLRETNYRTIMKGSVQALQAFVSSNPTLSLAGNLVIKEYTEDAIPQAVARTHFDESRTFEEQISAYTKRAGKDGPALKKEGKRIVRFCVWDMSGAECDTVIAHDNVEEVAAYNAVKATSTGANLPG